MTQTATPTPRTPDRRRARSPRAVAAAVLLWLGGGPVALAEEPAGPGPFQADRGWAVQITPYLWGTGLSGEVAPVRRLPPIHVEKSFAEVLGDLDFGGFVNVWARRDRYVFSGDLMYVSTTDSKRVSGVPFVGFVNATTDTRQFTSTLQAGYRVVSGDRFTLDALAGARMWWISNSFNVQAGPASGTYGEDFGWVDPLIGARAFLKLGDRLSVMAQADAGGFGAGARSTFSALATANYELSQHLSVSAGYKYLKTDYRKGGHVFDTEMGGPVLGLTYRF